ncbi:MAG: hypothetical protein ACRDLL_12125 [Solirubrobacterales bacterium]
MFLLRALFRSLTSSILRLAVLAGLLVIGYLLVAKPLLHSASDAVKATESRPLKVIHCMGRANGDVKRIERCARRF